MNDSKDSKKEEAPASPTDGIPTTAELVEDAMERRAARVDEEPVVNTEPAADDKAKAKDDKGK